MRKVGELFAHDSERATLAKPHRLTSHTFLAYVSMILFHVQRLLTTKQSSMPANLWLLEHMHEFIEQRLHDINTNKSADDVIQLMVDAVHSNKVGHIFLRRYFIAWTPRSSCRRLNY